MPTVLHQPIVLHKSLFCINLLLYSKTVAQKLHHNDLFLVLGQYEKIVGSDTALDADKRSVCKLST